MAHEITRVAASVGQWRIQSLQFHIHLALGAWGGDSWSTSLPVGSMVEVFGGNAGALGNLLSLGFYTGNSMSCTKMDGSGVRRVGEEAVWG